MEEKNENKNIELANGLYDQVMVMSQDMLAVDEVKSQLIIEYAKDAIDLYGKTNQARKIELRQIIEKAEQIISPDSIETLKKRAEKVVLKVLYPRRPKLRNALIAIIGLILMVFIFIYPIKGLWDYISSQSAKTSDQKHSDSPQDSSQLMQVVLILCDLSPSLSPSENKKTAALAADILDNLPQKSIYAVYPVQVDAQQLPPLVSKGEVPKLRSEIEEAKYNSEKSKRRNGLEMQMDALSAKIRHLPTASRSCILNSLWFARDRLTEMAGTSAIDTFHVSFELVIISDMVEECNDSPIGSVSLNKQDTSEEMELARRFPNRLAAPNFSNVRVTIIFPLASDSPLGSKRSSGYYDLKEFWRYVFTHFGFKEEWFWDGHHIEWISNGELPDRLKPQN